MHLISHLKTKAVIILTLFAISFSAYAQAPNLLNYQGVARNAVGNPLPNQTMNLRLSVHNLSAAGAVVYSETRVIKTNLGGLFSVQVGSAGTSSATGTIGGVSWLSGDKYLQVEIDPASNNNYLNMGTVQLVSVPYAFNAVTAANALTVTTNANLTGAVTSNGNLTSLAASPTLTGVPTAPTAAPGTNTTQIATTEFVKAAALTVAAISGTSTANGASITSGVLSLAPADATNGGVITTGAQIFAGAKTFNSTITGSINGNATTATNITGLTTSVATLNNVSNTNTGDQTATTVANVAAGTIAATTVQAAINELDTEKANLASPTFTGTVNAPTFVGALTGNATTATNVTGTVAVANGGTGQTTYTDGQLLIGNTTGNTLTKATLTQGAGISITNTSGAITIANTAGMPSGTTPGDMNYWNGSAWVSVPAGSNGQTLTFYNGAPVWSTSNNPFANTVISSTGKIWMDRNLGATRVANAFNDHFSYGDLYQWGRGADGHQTIVWTSSTASDGAEQNKETITLTSTDVPGNGNFILVPNFPHDWRNPKNDNLWQGVNGINNPCPSGYRLPTDVELETERASWTGVNNSAGAFASPLKLPVSGGRSHIYGSLLDVGTVGYLWSSTVYGISSGRLMFNSSFAGMGTGNRAFGRPVRCLKN